MVGALTLLVNHVLVTANIDPGRRILAPDSSNDDHASMVVNMH